MKIERVETVLSLSQTTGYAIMAMSTLDPKREELVLEKDIARRTGISKPYLTKLLHRLGLAGLIETKRGNKGGVRLAFDPMEISVMQIFLAIEGMAWENRCLMGLPNCGGTFPCPLHQFWLVEREKILQQLQNMTLDKVIRCKQSGWRLPDQNESEQNPDLPSARV
jgi:Rrf2 family protein